MSLSNYWTMVYESFTETKNEISNIYFVTHLFECAHSNTKKNLFLEIRKGSLRSLGIKSKKWSKRNFLFLANVENKSAHV